MGRSGYDYDSVWEPNNQNWPEPVGEEEIAVAEADVACKQEVNLVGIWFAVESAYQRRTIQQNAEDLEPHRLVLEAEVANAAAVLNDQ